MWSPYRARSAPSSSAGSAGQPKKACSLICVTDAGIATDASAEQPLKAWSPIYVTDAGIATDASADASADLRD